MLAANSDLSFLFPLVQPAVATITLVLQQRLGQPQALVHTLLIHHLFFLAGIHSVHTALQPNEERIDMLLAPRTGFSSN